VELKLFANDLSDQPKQKIIPPNDQPVNKELPVNGGKT